MEPIGQVQDKLSWLVHIIKSERLARGTTDGFAYECGFDPLEDGEPLQIGQVEFYF